MPSEAILELQYGFNIRLQQLGQRFRLIRTGEDFQALMLAAPSVDPRMELGEDLREMATIESRRDLLPVMKYGDVVLQLRPIYALENVPDPPKWKITRRIDNTADFVIRYWVVKITEGDAGF